MCQTCVDAVHCWFPEIGYVDTIALLWGATCYPFGNPEQVERQLREMHEAGITTLDAAEAYAEAEMEQAMKEANV